MANPEHLAILKQGVEVWNKWREDNPAIKPNLRGAKLRDKLLEGANFSGADIRSTDFTNAKLQGANFTGAIAGLQKNWATFWVICSWLLAGLSGFFSVSIGYLISQIFESADQGQIVGWVDLIALVSFLVLIISQGVRVGAIVVAALIVATLTLTTVAGVSLLAPITETILTVAISTAMSTALAATLSLATVVVLLALAITETAGVVAIAVVIAVAIVMAVVVVKVATMAAAVLSPVAPVLTAITTVIATLVVVYIGWRAMKGDERDAWIRDFAIAIAATKGTSFQDADLTKADFTEATLNNTDLRNANNLNLILTCWRKAKGLDFARLGTTYLQNVHVRDLVITGKGENKKFARFDLRGLYLQEAQLINADLTKADLSKANLHRANLSQAILVRTDLNQANLSNTTLTGAYIENWGITRNTVFDGVKCDRVYLKLPTKNEPDPNQMPPSQHDPFGKNDFYIFITSVLDTLDLYHKQNINAGLAITVLKSLTQDYAVQFKMVGLENRGNDQFLIKLKVFGETSNFQLRQEFYARYEQTLSFYDPKKLMSNTENIVAKIIEEVKKNPGTQIKYLYNEGIVVRLV
ncbi:MAG: pentapeptide repeat-containing protein [Waterburya sp.]